MSIWNSRILKQRLRSPQTPQQKHRIRRREAAVVPQDGVFRRRSICRLTHKSIRHHNTLRRAADFPPKRCHFLEMIRQPTGFSYLESGCKVILGHGENNISTINWFKKSRWPESSKRCKLRKHHQFDKTRAANTHNTNNTNALQRDTNHIGDI